MSGPDSMLEIRIDDDHGTMATLGPRLKTCPLHGDEAVFFEFDYRRPSPGATHVQPLEAVASVRWACGCSGEFVTPTDRMDTRADVTAEFAGRFA